MREFASQKALISYAERKGLIYLWEGTPAFAGRQRLLSRDQYELAEVRTRSAFPWFESYQAASASLYDHVWMTG